MNGEFNAIGPLLQDCPYHAPLPMTEVLVPVTVEPVKITDGGPI